MVFVTVSFHISYRGHNRCADRFPHRPKGNAVILFLALALRKHTHTHFYTTEVFPKWYIAHHCPSLSLLKVQNRKENKRIFACSFFLSFYFFFLFLSYISSRWWESRLISPSPMCSHPVLPLALFFSLYLILQALPSRPEVTVSFNFLWSNAFPYFISPT